MKLTELEPQFLKVVFREPTTPGGARYGSHYVDSLAEADGIMFLCPLCFQNNGGPVGTHYIIVRDPSVPQTVAPIGGRWPMTGNGYEDLTLSPSIWCTGDSCQAHFFVRSGEIVMV